MKETRAIKKIRAALKAKGYTLHEAKWEPVWWDGCGDSHGGWWVRTHPVHDVIVAFNLEGVLSEIANMVHAAKA